MKLAAFVLASTLTQAAPPPEPAEPPARIVIQQGQSFRCLFPGGCYIANEAGVQELVDDVFEAGAASCAQRTKRRL